MRSNGAGGASLVVSRDGKPKAYRYVLRQRRESEFPEFDPARKSANLRANAAMNVMKLFRFGIFLPILFLVGAASVSAQSTDQSLPTPVLSGEISGTIKALDLGDPRLTRHYYAFEGMPGDLLITVEGKNLNADFDVFTAITLRPLMKATLYDNTSQEVTKGIYLRSHQILILRVEGRTPNDDPGRYQVRFGGTFAKFTGGIPVAEPVESAESETDESRSANRLSSVGATIPRPPAQVEETPEAKPTPENTEEPKPAVEEKPRPTTRRGTSRNPRRTARTTPAKPAPKTDATEAASESASTSPDTAKPADITPPGAQLIVERKDGSRIERPMATVRRVVVEATAIVIFLKSGKIERIPMNIVARMAIEPQQ